MFQQNRKRLGVCLAEAFLQKGIALRSDKQRLGQTNRIYPRKVVGRIRIIQAEVLLSHTFYNDISDNRLRDIFTAPFCHSEHCEESFLLERFNPRFLIVVEWKRISGNGTI